MLFVVPHLHITHESGQVQSLTIESERIISAFDLVKQMRFRGSLIADVDETNINFILIKRIRSLWWCLWPLGLCLSHVSPNERILFQERLPTCIILRAYHFKRALSTPSNNDHRIQRAAPHLRVLSAMYYWPRLVSPHQRVATFCHCIR